MRKIHVAAALALGLGLTQGGARADQGGQTGAGPKDASAIRKYKAQPLNLHKDQLLLVDANTARARMRAGDCAGALDAFDAALRGDAEDATLYRDRGLCHEKLGHPYPAMDDYRAYLTAAPDAPDAPGVRDRLSRLEDETSGRAPATAANDDTNVPSMEAASVPPPAKANQPADTDEDDTLSSPLRRGRGFGLAPWFSVQKWLFKGSSFGDANTWAEAIGGQLRYSVGSVGSFYLEVGYEHFDSTRIDSAGIQGLTTLVGFEARFPLDARYDNQLILGPEVGYDHLKMEPSNPAMATISGNAVIPRIRFGYRRMIQRSTSFDVSLDAGYAFWFASGQSGGGIPDLSSTLLVAANIAVVWGL
jgi:hypothetical protein